MSDSTTPKNADYEQDIAKAPYPGLHYYEADLASLFAGRERESRDCAELILRTRVLLLHGRTGCGKSSFLRAGVKPQIVQSKFGMTFERGFEVIRSGKYPLERFGAQLLKLADDLVEGGGSFGDLRLGLRARPGRPVDEDKKNEARRAVVESIKQKFSDTHFRKLVKIDCDAAFEAVSFLSSKLAQQPIFVIDQAEEVFTLREKEARESLKPDSDAPGPDDSEEDREDEVDQYFDFLHRVASEPIECRIVVSMRTEYKGQFDDRLAALGHPGPGFKGYFLDDLDREGLRAAILRPTLDAKTWKALTGSEEGYPRAVHRFVFEDEVVDSIVDDLMKADVPAGGVLPTLQVTCLRLWQLARAAGSLSERSAFKIRRSQRRQLGDVAGQIEEYVSESIEEVCSYDLNWPKPAGQIADDVHGVLARRLVKVEADGRAVTASIDLNDLIDEISLMIERSSAKRKRGSDIMTKTELKKAVKRLLENLSIAGFGLLRIEGSGAGSYVTLGHDSVALALHKWQLINKRAETSMMRMMMSSGSAPPQDLTADHLFPKSERPPKVVIYLPEDYFWSRQIPHFAMSAGKNGFGERLGIEFRSPADISVDPRAAPAEPPFEDRSPPSRWGEMRDRMLEREKSLRVAAHGDGGKESARRWSSHRTLIAAEWDVFPGRADMPGKSKFDRFEIRRWSDVMVSNLFVGNGLIGLAHKEVQSIPYRQEQKPELELTEMIEAVRQALTLVMEKQGRIAAYNTSGRRFIQFAAKVANLPEFLDYIDASGPDGKDNFITFSDDSYDAADPLVQWLVRGPEEYDTEARPHFIVGSAFSRAMATQAGFTLFFGAAHLAQIGQLELINRERKKDADSPMPLVSNVKLELQDIVSHTVWQLGIHASQWERGMNRATVLRLAALGYFTVEYIRTNPNEFVQHVHEFVNRMLKQAATTKARRSRGLRLSRAMLKQSIKDCFQFLKFEEYGKAVYDLDSTYAYWSDHGALDTKTIARDVYTELARLRLSTLSHFSRIMNAISWMRHFDEHHAEEPRLKEAAQLKEYAWANFHIMNFYDSERFMARAATLYEAVMQSRGRSAGYDDKD